MKLSINRIIEINNESFLEKNIANFNVNFNKKRTLIFLKKKYFSIIKKKRLPNNINFYR